MMLRECECAACQEYDKMAEKKYTEAEWRDIEDLRKHWGAFCDADPFDGADTFIERMDARGYVQLRRVTKAHLSESFAAERGIEAGGFLWELTKKGCAAMTTATQDNCA